MATNFWQDQQKSPANASWTCESCACLKAHCKQNLTLLIPPIWTQIHSFTYARIWWRHRSRMAGVVRAAESPHFAQGTQVWCSSTEDSFNAEGQNLKYWKLCSMLNISYADCPGLSVICQSFFVKFLGGISERCRLLQQIWPHGGLSVSVCHAQVLCQFCCREWDAIRQRHVWH